MADINLTTTAVSATTTNIVTLRNRLRQELHDEDSSDRRWLDAVLDRHLTRAARELSLVLPQEQKTSLTTTPGSRDVSIASLSDLVRVDAVEYPTAQWPPAYIRFAVYKTMLTLLVEGAPASAQSVDVYWGALHTLNTSASSLPPSAEDAVVLGAGGYAALEWASFATNRANVAGTAAFDNYQAWGEDRLTRFREALRAFGSEARLRNASLYRPERGSSRSTVQWPG
jgi:hypothetical protein